MEVLFNFSFINFLPTHTVEAAESLQPYLPNPKIRVKATCRRLNPDKVDYLEGALQLLVYELCLKIIDHISGSTWGPGPSRFRL